MHLLCSLKTSKGAREYEISIFGHKRVKYKERYTINIDIVEHREKRAGIDSVILSKVNIYISVSCFRRHSFV